MEKETKDLKSEQEYRNRKPGIEKQEKETIDLKSEKDSRNKKPGTGKQR